MNNMENTTDTKETFSQKFIKLTESDPYQALVESFAGVMFGAFLVQAFLTIVTLSLGKTLFWLQFAGLLLTFVAYILFKNGAKASHIIIGNLVLKSSPLIFLIGTIFSFLRGTISKMPADGPNPMPFIIMLSIGLIIGYFILMKNESMKEFFNDLENKFELSKIVGENIRYEEGDMIIGKHYDVEYKENGEKVYKETNEDVILPLKDRYLHMLIIGPTGSGKTSQVLIPQINRDIQTEDLGLIVLEPKGDLAEQVYAMGEHYGRDNVRYFNPTHPDCPYFNPLSGPEDEVIENMTTTFKTLSKGSSTFFEDQGEMLIRRALSVLKRMEKDPKASEFLYGDEATMIDLSTLIHNNESKGRRMVTAFSKIPVTSDEMQKENDDIAAWFLADYFTGSNSTDTRGATKTYEHTSGMRNQVAKLVSNVYLRKVLNPPKGFKNEVDFGASLEQGHVLALTTNQGKLRDLGRFLGYFLILQLQSAIFKRPGNEDTRRGCMLFIDEFQVYANDGFEDMLTQGRSYRVACHLATQAIDQISSGNAEGRRFLAVVKTNCRNLIAFPDIDPNDAKWFSDNFGEVMVSKVNRGTSQQKFGPANWMKWRPVNESVRKDERMEPRFSPAEIMGRRFGEITYKIMYENNVAEPGVAKIEYIPWELKQVLDTMVNEYNERMEEEYTAERIGHHSTPPQDAHSSLAPVFDDVVAEEEHSINDENAYAGFLDDDLFGDDEVIERGNFVQDDGVIEEDL